MIDIVKALKHKIKIKNEIEAFLTLTYLMNVTPISMLVQCL